MNHDATIAGAGRDGSAIAGLYASDAANNTRIDFPLTDRSLVIRSN